MSASTAPVASTSASAATGAMSGASRRQPPGRRRVAGLGDRSPVSRFGPTATTSPSIDRRSPATATSPARSSTSPSSAPDAVEAAGDVAAVDLAGEAEREVGRAPRPSTLPAGTARRELDRDRPAVAGGAPAGGQRAARAAGRSARGRRARASKPMSVRAARDLPVRGEAELRVLDPQVLGAKARLVAHRAAGDRGLAGEQPVEPRVAEREVGGAAVEGRGRSRRDSGRDAAARPAGRSRRRAAARRCPAKHAEVGDADGVAPGVDHVRELAGAEDRQAVAAELELADLDRRRRAAARRRRRGRCGCRAPRATSGSACQTPVARPSTLTVTLRRAGSSRFCARPPSRSVTSSMRDVGRLAAGRARRARSSGWRRRS